MIKLSAYYLTKNLPDAPLVPHDPTVEQKRKEAIYKRAFFKPNYDDVEGSFEDYADLATFFGYCTMFIASFPLTIVIALVYGYAEKRLLGWKMSFVYRRPMPRYIFAL